MEKFKIKLIDPLKATKIWETSPNACIYNNPIFLKNFKKVKILSALKGDEIMCCWPILAIKKKMIIPSFFYYFGPYWSFRSKELPKHSWLSTSNNIYSKFIEYFIKNFKEVNFQFHHTLLDVRIFDWWNYGSKKKRFKIFPKYSAIINLDKKDHKEITSSYRHVRRYEIKNFIKFEDKVESCKYNFDKMAKLYIDNNSVKYTKIEGKKLKNEIKYFCELANKGFGQINCFKDKGTNNLIYFNVILFDKKTVHLAVNSCDKKWKKTGIMAWGVNSLLNEYIGKFKLFDFNGANSPFRGDDKHSYGAEEKLYFQLKF